MKYVLISFSAFLIACATSKPLIEDKNILGENELALATREEGMVVCRRAELEACGVRLFDCNSQLKYECTTSVIVIDTSDLPTSETF